MSFCEEEKGGIPVKVLVTGGAGFIGSHVVDQLVLCNHQVVIVDDVSSGNWRNALDSVVKYPISITSPDLHRVFEHEQPEVVYHLAAQTDMQRSIREPLYDAYVHILGTLQLLECCQLYGVRKIIYSSSASVYGNPQYLAVDEEHPITPLSAYGQSKFTPETYIRLYHEQCRSLKYTILRYGNVYGERQSPATEDSVVSVFMNNMLLSRDSAIFGNGTQTRDFIHVRDAARANVLTLESPDNQVLNISSGEPTRIIDLYKQLQLLTNGNDPVFKNKRLGEIEHIYLRRDLAREQLGWEPLITLTDGLAATYEYYKQQLHVNSEAVVI